MVPRREVSTPPQGTENGSGGKERRLKHGKRKERCSSRAHWRWGEQSFWERVQPHWIIFSMSVSFVSAALRMFTYACRQRVVPLRQVVRDALTSYGSGAVQNVTRVALELHQGADSEVITETSPKARLGDRATLRGAGPWHSWSKKGKYYKH